MPGDIGRPDAAPSGKIEPLESWGFDERGSFNAVRGFLHSLGVRWYLPGELGEVVPTLKSIPLPKIDETVRPDFAAAAVSTSASAPTGSNTALWAMRLGTRDPLDIQIAHGMAPMTDRDAIFAAHPEWFALYGGKRHYQPGYSKNQLCYSNEELFQETVRYVRAQFDHYKLEMVSVMPPDGYTAICQCKLCEGKDSPERDERGLLSDYVWDFVNRVAKEVAQDASGQEGSQLRLRRLLAAAAEDRQAGAERARRHRRRTRPAQQQAGAAGGSRASAARRGWRRPTTRSSSSRTIPSPIAAGICRPSRRTRSGESVNATKGISQGEDIWLSIRQDFDKAGVGFNHFLVYFTARMYWGGKELDVDAMFREYCRLFYGPAEQEMHAFFTYCEANWQEMEKDKTKADAALALLRRGAGQGRCRHRSTAGASR